MRGLLITLEGVEGSGKTTQRLRLAAYLGALAVMALGAIHMVRSMPLTADAGPGRRRSPTRRERL